MPKPSENKISYSSESMLKELPTDCGPALNKHDRKTINDLLLDFYYFNTTRQLFPNLPCDQVLQQYQISPKNYLTHLLQSIEALHEYFICLPYQYYQCTQFAISWIERVTGGSAQESRILEEYYLKAAAIFQIGAKYETFEKRHQEWRNQAKEYYEKAKQLYHDRPYPSFDERLLYICSEISSNEKILQASIAIAQQFMKSASKTTTPRSPANNPSSLFGSNKDKCSTLRLRVKSARYDSQQEPLLPPSPISPPIQV